MIQRTYETVTRKPLNRPSKEKKYPKLGQPFNFTSELLSSFCRSSVLSLPFPLPLCSLSHACIALPRFFDPSLPLRRLAFPSPCKLLFLSVHVTPYASLLCFTVTFFSPFPIQDLLFFSFLRFAVCLLPFALCLNSLSCLFLSPCCCFHFTDLIFPWLVSFPLSSLLDLLTFTIPSMSSIC